MNKLWMVWVLLLAGCNANDSTKSPSPPTAIYFSDSVGLAASGVARLNLRDKVDLRHNSWSKENIAPEDAPWYYAAVVKHGQNDGWAYSLVINMEQELQDEHYNVLLLNAGLHDAELGEDGTARDPLNQYASYIEIAAQEAEQHADIVIWIDTTPIPADLDAASGEPGVRKNAQIPYNAIAEQIAKNHHFYILRLDSKDQLPNNVHYSLDGYKYLGKQVSECVLSALNQEETQNCHK